MPSLQKNHFRARLIVDGVNALQAILSCIQQARYSIRIRMFMWRDDEAGRTILYALEKKIRETPSISIHIEKDAFGSKIYNIQKWWSWGRLGGDIFSSDNGEAFLKKYRKNVRFSLMGSKSFLFFKILKENDHSKVFLFDDTTPHVCALVGGMNIANEYLTAPNKENPDKGGWHDYMVYIEGESANYILPTIPKKKEPWFMKTFQPGMSIVSNLKGRRQIKKQIARELSQAQKSVVVEHGYITDDSIIRKLRKLARSGIKVLVILPDRSDGVYNANMHSIHKLLKPTVVSRKSPMNLSVYLYKGMIHAKVLVMDSYTTIIGSANLTLGSFDLLNEINAIFRGKNGITKSVLTQIKKDLHQSTHITFSSIPLYKHWRARLEKFLI